MKKIVALFVFLSMTSCGKHPVENNNLEEINDKNATYDTVAIDSFSQGAISVDIARKIKMSTVAYQDSLKEVRKKLEAEKILKKEKEESEKASKKIEEDRKKADAVKTKKQETSSESSGTN